MPDCWLEVSTRKVLRSATSCVVVMKSGNLNFLKPWEPLQACNWTAKSIRHCYIQHLYIREIIYDIFCELQLD